MLGVVPVLSILAKIEKRTFGSLLYNVPDRTCAPHSARETYFVLQEVLMVEWSKSSVWKVQR